MPDIPKSPSAAVHPGPDKLGTSPLFVFLSRYGDKILALIPLAFLIWFVAQYAVDVPYNDQWELVPLLEKTYHGELTFHDLWVQHNEHRLVFPQIIMLLLARLTRWNIHYEQAVNIILALGIFAVFIRQVRITGRKPGIAGLPWAIPAISLIVFSISQYENWLWGWQLQMFLNCSRWLVESCCWPMKPSVGGNLPPRRSWALWQRIPSPMAPSSGRSGWASCSL